MVCVIMGVEIMFFFLVFDLVVMIVMVYKEKVMGLYGVVIMFVFMFEEFVNLKY